MENSQQELNRLSPLLASCDKSVQYPDLPENYFSNLEDNLLSHMSIIQTDDRTSGPDDDYFRQLESNIMTEIHKKSPRLRYLRWMTYAAAAVFAGLIVFLAWPDVTSHSQEDYTSYSLHKEDIEILQYVVEDIEMAAEYGLIEEEDLLVTEFPEAIQDDELYFLFDQF
jgi:hypothetical protein